MQLQLCCHNPRTSSSFNRSKTLTGSARLLKLSPGPTVVPGTICTLSVIGNSSPVLYTTKKSPTSEKSSSGIDRKREAGRKAAAISLSLRKLIMFVPVRPVDEKLLPVMTTSASGTYIVQCSWRDENRKFYIIQLASQRSK